MKKIMRKAIYSGWNLIMDDKRNPLSNIPDMNTRHMVMQVLAWMWCIIFGMSVGSITVFGISAIAHTLLLAGIAITVGTFETARSYPSFFNKFPTATPSRTRQYMWINGKKIKLDDHDKGGEHE